MTRETEAQELDRLRRENANLREAIARRDGIIAGLRWLMREAHVQEPTTPEGVPIWPVLPTHEAGNA